MASIYKFKRKSKKEDESSATENQKNEFFPLLFDDANKKEEPQISASSCDEKKEPSSSESLYSAFDKESGNIPKELLEALSMPKVDSEKMDAVFSSSRGTVGTDTSKEEYDQATDLLREIFGNANSPDHKKKKKLGESEASDEYVAVHDSEEETTKDYVAVHDGDDESTKEYTAAFSVGEAGQALESELTRTDLPPLADEINMGDENSDDPYSDTYDELETKSERKPILPDEYTSPEEYDEFAEHLRGRNFRNLCSVIWSFFALLAVLYLESATFSKLYHPEILTPGGTYNIIYLLVDLQIVLISALLILPSIAEGFKGMFNGKPTRNSAVFLMYLMSAIHPIVLLFTGAKEYPLFGSVAATFAFLTCIASFLDSKRIYRTFRICGNRNEKLVAKDLDGDSPEAEAFREQLTGEPRFFSIQKAGFIDNFFERITKRGKSERSFGTILILSLLLSIGFAAFSYWKVPDIAGTANAFMATLAMTLPLSCIFTVSLPFSHLSAKAEKIGAAIISTAAAEEYAAADAVSFTDKEIFPPKSVKVTTIRTYGETRIDKAILYAAMIFQKLGGPLSEVFKKTISGFYDEISEDFDFLEITADGMCAKIEDCDVFVGNKDYLLSYDFGYTKDEKDEAFEEKNGKIMYMVIGSELAAKFYIRYSISKQFKKTVLALYRSGICPAVKTCDPNIDSNLFRTLLQNSKIPAGIIKSCEAMKDAPAAEHSESGIVCTSSIAKLLRTFSLCESLRHLTRTNVIMKILSVFIGLGIVVFLYYIGNLSRITGLFVLIYQLLWLIPVIIPSMTE